VVTRTDKVCLNTQFATVAMLLMSSAQLHILTKRLKLLECRCW